MPQFRPRFGSSTVTQLNAMLCRWRESAAHAEKPNPQIKAAERVLEAYQRRHQELGIDVSDLIDVGPIEDCESGSNVAGGVMPCCIPDAAEREIFVRVMRSRSSVRHFDRNKVPDQALIGRAVASAISSPSVCNRQSWRVHCFSDSMAQQVLALQNGNRGFGQSIPLVMVVTSDMRSFTTTVERNQPWIDGGMFAMTLLLGLHGEGLGAVPLNWSVLNSTDKQLRGLVGIPDYERVIMLIGCGHPVVDCLVTRSQRRSCAEILNWNRS